MPWPCPRRGSWVLASRRPTVPGMAPGLSCYFLPALTLLLTICRTWVSFLLLALEYISSMGRGHLRVTPTLEGFGVHFSDGGLGGKSI